MRDTIGDIDHCSVLVRDLHQAADAFTRLGFAVGPRGTHTAEMGTGNHNIVLDHQYVELLGVLDATDVNRELRDALAVREGIGIVALRTADTAAAVAEMQAADIAMTPPYAVRRPVDLPEGGRAEAEFTISFFAQPVGGVRLFVSQIHQPEYLWVPARMVHPNTAWGIEQLGVVSADPASATAELTRVLDGGAPIVAVTQQELADRYPEVDLSALAPSGPALLSIKVDDTGVAAEQLSRSDVTYASYADSLAIAPVDAGGVLLVLRQVPRPGTV